MKTLQELTDNLQQIATDAKTTFDLTNINQFGILAMALHAVLGAIYGNQWATLQEAGVELAENGIHALQHPNN